jgi:hypothetical protein
MGDFMNGGGGYSASGGDATSGSDGFFETGAFNGGNIAATSNNTALYVLAGVALLAVLWLKK